MFWILEEQDNTKLSSDFESDFSNNTYLARLWKFKILQCLYELIKRFANQPSGKIAGELSVVLFFQYSVHSNLEPNQVLRLLKSHMLIS